MSADIQIIHFPSSENPKVSEEPKYFNPSIPKTVANWNKTVGSSVEEVRHSQGFSFQEDFSGVPIVIIKSH